MRLLHLSDLHLGYRQYQRQTPRGQNQREVDVALAFRRAVDRAIELRPDLVVVAGDIFHNVRPTNSSILHAYIQFSRLRQQLADAVVVLVAGNHDTPRTSESSGILRLYKELGIHIADAESERFDFPDRDLSILAVPDVPGPRTKLEPNPSATRNVLLLHGEIEGVLPRHLASEDRAALEISREELGADRWTYVALGHYHVYREVAPNACYSGSLEYASANIWGEMAEEREAGIEGKGMVEFDLATGERTFHPHAPVRALVDLPLVSARGMSSADLDAALRANVEGVVGGIDERIVRQIVRDVPRHIARELDHKSLRDYKRRALNYQLDTRRPEILRQHASGAPGRRPSLTEVVQDKLRSRLISGDIDREALVELGLKYLRDADAVAAVTAVTDGDGVTP